MPLRVAIEAIILCIHTQGVHVHCYGQNAVPQRGHGSLADCAHSAFAHGDIVLLSFCPRKHRMTVQIPNRLVRPFLAITCVALISGVTLLEVKERRQAERVEGSGPSCQDAPSSKSQKCIAPSSKNQKFIHLLCRQPKA